MVTDVDTLTDKFSRFFAEDIRNADRISSPGSQYVIQLLRGGRIGDHWLNGDGRAALDIGCGNGFNLVSLARMGWRVSGCDTSDRIVGIARSNAERFGADAEVRVGTNTALPYPDAMFDLVLSMNVVHYAPDEATLDATVREYARVMVPGGLLVMSTNHPSNWLLAGAENVGGNMHVVAVESDFRSGERLYVFRNPAHIRRKLNPFFSNIRVGRNSLYFVDRNLSHFIVLAERRRKPL